MASSNFAFLPEHDPVFLQLASTAEQVFANDPNTTLIKLRQLMHLPSTPLPTTLSLDTP